MATEIEFKLTGDPEKDKEKLAAINKMLKLVAEMAEKRAYWDFFFHLGFAVNKWAAIDAGLFTLFRFALNARDDVKTALLYYQKPGVSERFQLVDMLIRRGLNQRQIRKWNEVKKEIERLLPFRNRLAHDPSNAVISAKTDNAAAREFFENIIESQKNRLRPQFERPAEHPEGTYYELNIAETKLLRALSKPIPPPIRLKEIKAHSADLLALQFKMAEFLTLLPKRLIQRALRPLSKPPQPKILPSRARSKRRPQRSRRLPRPPRSSQA